MPQKSFDLSRNFKKYIKDGEYLHLLRIFGWIFQECHGGRVTKVDTKKIGRSSVKIDNSM